MASFYVAFENLYMCVCWLEVIQLEKILEGFFEQFIHLRNGDQLQIYIEWGPQLNMNVTSYV